MGKESEINGISEINETDVVNVIWVYILSPVRNATEDQKLIIDQHVKTRKKPGVRVFNPAEDAPQEDKTGYNIVMKEVDFLYQASQQTAPGVVDILWNLGGKPSEGSRVDVGIALGFHLTLNLVETFDADKPSTGPQVAYQIIQEIFYDLPEKPNTQKAFDLMDQMKKNGEAVIDWNIDMTDKDEEWQRISLGMALACQAQDPNFKIKQGFLIGEDDPNKKSYPKVIAELSRRSSL